jgi:CheY-like chemotaxis protein
VADGAQAVRQVQARPYDVVLMDVQMPVLDGEAATRAIRALPGPERAVPIIAMTANALAEHRAAYLAAGMDDYLTKPVDMEALARALARVARREAVAAS